jgi:hypothetical protein
MGSGVAMLSGPRQTRRGLSPQLRDVCSLGPTAGAVRHPLCVGRSKELIRWARSENQMYGAEDGSGFTLGREQYGSPVRLSDRDFADNRLAVVERARRVDRSGFSRRESFERILIDRKDEGNREAVPEIRLSPLVLGAIPSAANETQVPLHPAVELRLKFLVRSIGRRRFPGELPGEPVLVQFERPLRAAQRPLPGPPSGGPRGPPPPSPSCRVGKTPTASARSSIRPSLRMTTTAS